LWPNKTNTDGLQQKELTLLLTQTRLTNEFISKWGHFGRNLKSKPNVTENMVQRNNMYITSQIASFVVGLIAFAQKMLKQLQKLKNCKMEMTHKGYKFAKLLCLFALRLQIITVQEEGVQSHNILRFSLKISIIHALLLLDPGKN
jgi:uncharacterized membrane protein YiaA